MSTLRRNVALAVAMLLVAVGVGLAVSGTRPAPEGSAWEPDALPARAGSDPGRPGAGGATPAAARGSDGDEELLPVDMPDPPPPPGGRGDASGPDAVRRIFSGYGFPGHPGLTHWCGKRDFEPGSGKLVWDAFTTDEPPASVVAHYRRWLGTRGFAPSPPGGTWRLPPGSPAASRSLHVTAPDGSGRHHGCDGEPPPGTLAVIVLSRY